MTAASLAPAPAREGSVRAPDAPPASRERLTRARRVAPWAVAAVVFAVGMMAIGPWPVGVFFDDGIYLVLGRALASGQGYHYLHLPGLPAATHYPPGYPALLALLWRLGPDFPENVSLMQGANVALMAAASAGATIFARDRLRVGDLWASVAVVAFALAIPVLAFTTVLFSEPLFLALLFPALLASERAAERGRSGDVAMAAALGAALFLVRTLGGALLAALVVVLLVRRHWRAAAVACAVGLAAVLPWQLWVAVHTSALPPALDGHYGPYLGWVLDGWARQGPGFVAATVLKNLRLMATGTATIVRLPLFEVATPLLVVAAAGFLIAGVAAAARRAPVTALMVAGYLLVVLLWPFAPYRFLWGIWPLVGILIAAGATTLAQARPAGGATRALRVAAACAGVTAAVGYASYNARGMARGWYASAQRAETAAMLPVAQWVASRTPPDAVVATESGPFVWLYTGRAAVPTTSFTPEEYVITDTPDRDARQMLEILRAYPVRAVIASSPSSSADAPARILAARRPPALVFVETLSNGGAAWAPVVR